MEETIKANKPSISTSEIANYEKIREKMEGTSGNSRASIGFRK
jgi:hypothetical protein